jgi:hypothetical protein
MLLTDVASLSPRSQLAPERTWVGHKIQTEATLMQATTPLPQILLPSCTHADLLALRKRAQYVRRCSSVATYLSPYLAQANNIA